jgi:ribosomal protein L7/L12
MNNNIIHLDRLPLADLGKFSMIISEILTSEQRANLNVEFPEMMGTMGAFETQIPQVNGYVVTQKTWDLALAGIKARQIIAAIKEIRGGTGMGLKEAKEYVDNHMKHLMP